MASLLAGISLLAGADAAHANAPGGIEIVCEVDRNEFRASATGQVQICFSLWSAETSGSPVGGVQCVPTSALTVVRQTTETFADQKRRSFARVSGVIGNDAFPILPDTNDVWLQMHVGASIFGCDASSDPPRRRRIQSVLFARRALAGVACWDLNENGVCDAPGGDDEDVDDDGLCTALDCQGATGAVGPSGPAGPSMPTGSMVPFAGAAAPGGWLLCDGSAVSRATYADLFAVLGTTYGAGDQSSTFNLPDLRGRVPTGRGTHADVDSLGDSEGLGASSRTPRHAHVVNAHAHGLANTHDHQVDIWSAGEVFSHWSGSNRYPNANFDNFAHKHAVNGWTQIFGRSQGDTHQAGTTTNVQTPGYLTMSYIIKY